MAPTDQNSLNHLSTHDNTQDSDHDDTMTMNTSSIIITTDQAPPTNTFHRFFDLPDTVRDRIYDHATSPSRSLSSPALISRPCSTARALRRTSRLVAQESMKVYYGKYTFWHMVFSFREVGAADDDIWNNKFLLQRWLDTWGGLAFENIRKLEIDVVERRRGESCTHKMFINLDDVESPVTTEFSYWGPPTIPHWDIKMTYLGPRLRFWKSRVAYKSSKQDDNLADLNALVRALVVKLPEDKCVFTPERFKALLKGLWHSYVCVGDSIAPRKRPMTTLEKLRCTW